VTDERSVINQQAADRSDHPTTGRDVDAAEADESDRFGQPLPSLRTDRSPHEVVETLDRAARRGRLPGFRSLPETGRFAAAAFGEPFDRELVGACVKHDSATRIDFTLRPLLRMPLIALLIVVLTIWPGVWLTDSILTTYFPGYPRAPWVTPAWYLPITVLPALWTGPRMWRRSARAADRSAREATDKIQRELGAERIEPDAPKEPGEPSTA